MLNPSILSPQRLKKSVRLSLIFILAAIMLTSLLLSFTSRAATLTVGSGGTYATIQAAVDAATPGDTILVQDETFTGRVIITKSVTLLGGYNSSFTSRVPRTTLISPTMVMTKGGAISVTGKALQVTVDGFEIANASVLTDGGAIYVVIKDDSSIIINNNYLHDNHAGVDSGAMTVNAYNRSYLQITNNDIMSNTAGEEEGAFQAIVRISSTLVITGNSIISNTAGTQEGGMDVEASDFSQFQFEDNLVMSNTAQSNHNGGMRFSARRNSHGSFDRNQFIGNASLDNGGANIEISENSSSTFYDNTFKNNVAGDDHGGLDLKARHQSHVNGDNLLLVGNRSDSYGGGYIYTEYNSSLTLPNIQVISNRANSSYGGVYIKSNDYGLIDVPNLYVYNNRAIGGRAGGLYLATADGRDTILATNARIISNTAPSNGGGAYVYAEDGSLIDLTGSQFISNTTGANGGGLYIGNIYNGSTVLLNNTDFLTNTANDNGGGAYCSGCAYDGSALELSYARFISNSAATDGGGLYLDEMYDDVTLLADHTQFISNTAGSDGGGVYLENIYQDAQANFDDSLFMYNTANITGTGYGGGLYSDACEYNCDFSLQRSTFMGNRAKYGGGLYFYDVAYGARAYIDHNDFISNTAASLGGAIYVDYPGYGDDIFSFSDNTVISNTAGSDGGGVYQGYGVYYGAQGYFDNNLFQNNKAGGDGGAFYVYDDCGFACDGGWASFSGNQVISNTAGGGGGGFYSDYGLAYYGSTAIVNDNWFEGNTAADDGGGFYAYYNSDGTIEYGSYGQFNRNTVINNISGDDGGGVYFHGVEYGSQLEFNDNTISNNVISSTGNSDGGGLWFYTVDEGSVMTMTGNVINNNIATYDGGGLYWDDYVDYGSKLIFANNELQWNLAGNDGGGCMFDEDWEDAVTINFYNNIINHNVAHGDYGACYVTQLDYGARANFYDNQFNYNTAAGDVGGLTIDDVSGGSTFHFWDNQIMGNRAGISETLVISNQVVYTNPVIGGGGVAGLDFENIEDGSQVYLNGNAIISNTAYISGTSGGNEPGLYAYVTEGSLLSIVDNVVAENVAQSEWPGLLLQIYDGSRLIVHGNVISANTAMTASGAIDIWADGDSHLYLSDNKVLNNQSGSGIQIWDDNDDGDPLTTAWNYSQNNLVANNTGPGLYLEDTSLWSANDTFADNSGYGVWMTGTVASTAYLSNTIVWGNSSAFSKTQVATYTNSFTMLATTSDIQGGWPGVGNINADPLFVGGGDYHQQAGSPVIDTGATLAEPKRDLDNVPRPVGLAYDMGVYEYRLPGVTVTGDGTLSGPPGSWVTHTITISNTGNAEDEFSLTVSGGNWTSQLSDTSVVIGANSFITVSLSVQVPYTASANASDTTNVDATSARNALIVDGDSVETVASQVASVAIAPNNSAVANVNATQYYQHVVSNNGNGQDTINLSVSSSQGWAVQVNPASVLLSAGESATVTVVVNVPANGGGLTDQTTITATSQVDVAAYDVATDETSALNSAGLSLTAGQSGNIPAGDSVMYAHTLTNNASISDTVSLTATSASGWATEINPTAITLGAGMTSTVYITVTAPGGAGNGATDVTSVWATSGNDSNVKASATDVTVVENPSDLSLVPNNTATALAGTSQVYSHTLTNNASVADDISLSVSSDQGWTVSVSPGAVNLGAGMSTTVWVTVTAVSSGPNGLVDVSSVQAASGNSGGTGAVAVDITTLLNPASLKLSASQAYSTGENTTATYTHTVTNDGANTDTLSLQAVSAQGWVTQLDSSAVTLQAGQTATVVLQVHVPAGASVGTTDVTTLTATSAYGSAANVSNTSATTVIQTINTIFLPLVMK